MFTIVYEILGSATESDDVLQDSYLRWAEVDLATVRDTKSYLAQLVTRQALNALRAGARRREDYIGPWLPEPLLLDERDASADVVLAESVSMAMLVLLETLTPDERAVFVLREVFGFDYDEIAGAVGKSVANCASGRAPGPRTCAGAAQAVRTRRLRQDGRADRAVHDRGVDGRRGRADGDAGAGRDLDGRQRRQGLRGAQAHRRRAEGGDRHARALFRVAAERMPDVRFETAVYNSSPAMVVYNGDQLEGVFLIEITDGRSPTSTRCATRTS